MNTKIILLIVATILTSGGAVYAATELVVNGGFETPVLKVKRVDFFPNNPGWNSVTVGCGIEIQNEFVGPAAEGFQYTELASDCATGGGVSQEITIDPEKAYLLGYSFSPRPGVIDNSVEVIVEQNGSGGGSLTRTHDEDGSGL